MAAHGPRYSGHRLGARSHRSVVRRVLRPLDITPVGNDEHGRRAWAPTSRRPVLRSVAIVVGSVGVFAVALLALALVARGASGASSALSTLSHLAGVIGSVPLGYALSRLSPARIWPVVTVAGTALVLFAPLLITDTVLLDTGRSLLSVSLGWGISAPDTGWAVPTTIGLLRIGYFTLLAVGCTMMAGTVIRRGATRDKFVALAPAALPVGLLAAIGLVSPNLHLVVPTPVQTVCDQPGPGLQVCVASDDHALLGDISATVGTLASLAPPTQPVLITIPLETNSTEATIWLPEVAHASTRQEFDQQVARSVAYGLLAPGDCSVIENTDVPDEYWRGVLSKMLTLIGAAPEQTGVVEASGEPVYGNGYDQLESLSAEEFRDWLSVHIDEVRDCSLTAEQLP